MAGKHQIWSSKSKTKQKAKRCWRRQAKQRLQTEPLKEGVVPSGDATEEDRLKRGLVVYESGNSFGTNLGEVLGEAKTATMDDTVNQIRTLIARWHHCKEQDFRSIFPDLSSAKAIEEYQRLCAMPLEFFLSLNTEQQYRFVRWLRSEK